MRLASILVSAVLLSCLSIQVHGDAGDIAVPSMPVPDMSMPAPHVTAPNMDVPAPSPKPLGKPNNNPNEALNQTESTSFNQATQIQQEVKLLNVSGKWSIQLNDGSDGSLDLNLWPSGGTRIMGYGTLTEGSEKSSVTASGSVTAQGLSLIAKSSTPEYANQKYDEYDLDLSMVNDTLSGSYILKSDGQPSVRGNASAIRE